MAYALTVVARRLRKRPSVRILREASFKHFFIPLTMNMLSVQYFLCRGFTVSTIEAIFIRLNTLRALFCFFTVGIFPHCGGSISTLVVGVFVGLLPLFLFLLCVVCFLCNETQIWPGDLRVVCGCVVGVFCCVLFVLVLLPGIWPQCHVLSFILQALIFLLGPSL